MNKRFFCVVIALLCVLFSSCSRKRQVDSNRELEIINKGSKITLDEDAAVLCDQIETIVEDVCDYQSFLTTLLSDSEYDSYKKNGLFVDLSSKSEKSFALRGRSKPINITTIRILMGEGMSNFIVYCPLDNVPKVYILPTKYCEEIVSILSIDFIVN